MSPAATNGNTAMIAATVRTSAHTHPRTAPLACVLLLAALPVAASTITVDVSLDAVPADTSDGVCSLREAVTAANTNAAVDTCVAGEAAKDDLIEFAATLDGEVIALFGELVVSGAGPVTIEGDIDGDYVADITLGGRGASRIIRVAGGDLKLRHLNLRNGRVTGIDCGGAVLNDSGGTLHLIGVLVRVSQSGGGGGGMCNRGYMEIYRSTIADNSAAFFGGGIFNDDNATELYIISSTVMDNASPQGKGGGLFSEGSSTIISSTFHGNLAGQQGGAIHVFAGHMSIQASTIVGNSATAGGGIHQASGLTAFVTQSILANNNGGNCGGTGSIDASYSLTWPSSDSSCPSNFDSGDPRLGYLRDNGGPTLTMLPHPGGAAVNASPCGSILFDQRGSPRPLGSPPWFHHPCDIGSVEYQFRADPIFRDGFDGPPVFVRFARPARL